MSTRITPTGASQQLHKGEERAADAQQNVRAQQTHAPNDIQVANWEATSNDALASELGRTAESWGGEALSRMPPGSKLEVELELKVGLAVHALAKTVFEAERLEDGTFEISKSEGGGVELSEHAGTNAEAGLKFEGGVKKSWHFATREQAQDAIAALAQREARDRGFQGGFDPDLDRRLTKLDAGVTSTSARVDAEVFVKAGAANLTTGGEGELKVGGSLTVTQNHHARTVMIDEAIGGGGRITGKAGLNGGALEVTAGQDVAAVTMRSKVRTTFELTAEQQASFDAGKSREVIGDLMKSGAGERKLIQQLEARFGDKAATARREVVLNDQLSLVAALHPGNIDVAWIASGGVLRSTSKVDAHVAELGLSSKLQLPGEPLGHANIHTVAALVASTVSSERRLDAERARANVSR